MTLSVSISPPVCATNPCTEKNDVRIEDPIPTPCTARSDPRIDHPDTHYRKKGYDDVHHTLFNLILSGIFRSPASVALIKHELIYSLNQITYLRLGQLCIRSERLSLTSHLGVNQ